MQALIAGLAKGPGPCHQSPNDKGDGMANGAEATVELGALIDQRPISSLQVLVTTLCAAMLFVDG
jgi:hypothetical protein